MFKRKFSMLVLSFVLFLTSAVPASAVTEYSLKLNQESYVPNGIVNVDLYANGVLSSFLSANANYQIGVYDYATDDYDAGAIDVGGAYSDGEGPIWYSFNAPEYGQYKVVYIFRSLVSNDTVLAEVPLYVGLPTSIGVIPNQVEQGDNVFFVLFAKDGSTPVSLPQGWNIEVSHKDLFALKKVDGTVKNDKIVRFGNGIGVYSFVAPNLDATYTVRILDKTNAQVGNAGTFKVGSGVFGALNFGDLLGGLDLSDAIISPDFDLGALFPDMAEDPDGVVVENAVQIDLDFSGGVSGDVAPGAKDVGALEFNITASEDINLKKVVMDFTGEKVANVAQVRLEAQGIEPVIGDFVDGQYFFDFGDGLFVDSNDQPEVVLYVDFAAEATNDLISFGIPNEEAIVFDSPVIIEGVQFPLLGRDMKITVVDDDGGNGGGGGNGGNDGGEGLAEGQIFSDIALDSVYYDSTKWAKENGIVKGYADGEFKPGVAISRVEILKTVLEAVGIDVPEEVPAKGLDRFTDISGEDWSLVYMYAALQEGIFNGDAPLDVAKTTARPGSKPNAVEALKIAFESAKVASDYELNEYSAEEVAAEGIVADAWFRHYWLAAVESELFIDEVEPGDLLTRGQFVEVLYRMNVKGIIEI
ncbi:S-layer homology domain-containing protein [Candidatus Peregrinibacteria bacterium]|nr:S-layer homology domain-containing protein [Candidatus Peregrinibacteria bacterium]